MQIIRTAEDMTRTLASLLDPYLQALLQAHVERLGAHESYRLDELAMFAIVEPGDTLSAISKVCGVRLVAEGDFTMPPEVISQQGRWIELIFILSDDGFGLVLLIEEAANTDPELLALCQRYRHQPG